MLHRPLMVSFKRRFYHFDQVFRDCYMLPVRTLWAAIQSRPAIVTYLSKSVQ
ncbi:hypothetical protein FIBSPDRAFT_592099 [Athelia psychrophila]|uniref:Uncharacterized protein n=1 Tax=Athelia psychrophila TaxID=1759441 RepID=A0A166H4G7_9AGAM|nr:hypothetical protein FIBSPDRAFT_67765 [Fibularhizoctonia sp. CBS 109695]KZP18471.1 hypothetical protein FIBSPDRAFT_592099 [Fibularhizoctonia sp. CBS 109695]